MFSLHNVNVELQKVPKEWHKITKFHPLCLENLTLMYSTKFKISLELIFGTHFVKWTSEFENKVWSTLYEQGIVIIILSFVYTILTSFEKNRNVYIYVTLNMLVTLMWLEEGKSIFVVDDTKICYGMSVELPSVSFSTANTCTYVHKFCISLLLVYKLFMLLRVNN
jgi:hypothetical protein